MFNYNAYNLGISSALPLPELQASAEVAADVRIRFGDVGWSPPDLATDQDLYFEFAANEAHFFWAQLGKFRVAGGSEITVDPCADAEERLLRLPLLGTILAVLLHQRGRFVLHASAVAIGEKAIAFVGNKGRGKSTMAAALYALGHQLVADDVVALGTDQDGRPLVLPGYPQFKLHPEAALSSLGSNRESLSELAEGYEKCGRRVTDRFARQPLPLAGIYVLGIAPEPTIKKLDSQTALLAVISNSYVARFGKQILHGANASLHLQECANLLDQVAVSRLERPGNLTLLSSIAKMVEAHVREIS